MSLRNSGVIMRHRKRKGTVLVYHYECEVFEASALRVSWGINEGDALGLPAYACLGDIYTLPPQAAPLLLRLEISDRTVIAPDQQAQLAGLTPGQEVATCGEMRLMSSDGEVVTALVLECCGTLLFLPLNPMRPDTGYALIALQETASALRMSELVQGCFGTGARVSMEDGSLCAVEDLQTGMDIRTRDHGPQTLRWIGQITMRAHGPFAPVTFAPNVLGNLGALTLGPLQRIFLYQRGEDRLGTRAEVLIQAQTLVDGRRVLQREGGFVTYYHLAFDDHQIIYVEGIPVESMLVSRATLARLPEVLAQDLSRRFPHLNQRAHFAQDLPSTQVTADIRDALLRQKEK
ncbi:Hint domain-containing protein [Roseinatronobacter thiooxidans]|uniref:Hint domain-containing protein n=1 Tax=Roseinatronobacter thiooxidans TaxID=121821 RepID=A0A2W7QLL1_9RHOB|nr:Hint domain-containing protein [Roseinatronobacter thiooxidans]PZX48186.1 Hint domain-containing protein [Roseinatronobacter thiooxidans]